MARMGAWLGLILATCVGVAAQPALRAISRVTSSKLTELPIPRSNPAVLSCANIAYCFGGNDAAGPRSDAWAYDVGQRTWLELPPMPEPRTGHGVVRWQQRFIVFGGTTTGDRAITTVVAYDPALRRWDHLKSMPFLLTRFGIACWQDRVYLLGGSTPATGTKSSVVHRYDPVKQNWDVGRSLPEPLDRLSAALLEDALYVTGGEGVDGRARATSWRLDPDATSWQRRADLTSARKNFALCRWGSQLVLAGGWDQGPQGRPVFLQSVESYDPVANRWSAVGRMQNARDACRAADVAGHLLVLGGFNGQFVSTVEELSALRSAATGDQN